jgi:hypothetical protein
MLTKSKIENDKETIRFFSVSSNSKKGKFGNYFGEIKNGQI